MNQPSALPGSAVTVTPATLTQRCLGFFLNQLHYPPCFFLNLVKSSISTAKYGPAEYPISYENKTLRESLWV